MKSQHLLRSALFTYTLSLVFLAAPFITQANMGGLGLDLGYNISIWTTVSWVISLGLILLVKNKAAYLPRIWPYLCLFPGSIIITSLITGTEKPTLWLFRELYILGGLSFLFALFQFNPTQRSVDKILIIIGISTFFHALLGSLQTFILAENLPIWSPQNNWSPRSIFQQINVQASFIATGLITIVYLISRPISKKQHWLTKVFWVITVALSAYVIAASGSRIGLLSILIGLPLVLISRRHQLKPHYGLLFAMLISYMAGSYIGESGLQRTFDKTASLSNQSYSNARITIYTIGTNIVKKKPLFGHGIGGYQKAWNQESANFFIEHPDSALPENVTHPHNEFLLWAIEGGALTLISILITFGAIGFTLFKCGFQRGGAYAAMLLPITFHTQVELPFYTSSLHWFIWLFLIYLPTRHNVTKKTLDFSFAANLTAYAAATCLAIGTSLFMYRTASAQADMTDFMLHKAPVSVLQNGLNNLYSKREAENILRITSLLSSIKSGNKENIRKFQTWALNYIKTHPEPRMYKLLILASRALNPDESGCKAALTAITIYPHSKQIIRLNEPCRSRSHIWTRG